ncbi:MAG: YIP1 family protein [Acidobacteriota bacterium]|nr:YIP1 family protein [Acidobacteriota bacterium]
MSDPNADFQAPPPPPTTEVVQKRPPKNLRVAAIVLFVLGAATIGAGLARVFPGGVGTGAAVAFLGIVLFALSFISLPEPGPGDPEPMGTFERLMGIFHEPTRVFRNLRAHPRWVAAVLVIALLNVAYVAAFTQRLTPERIVNYTADKMAETPFIPPEAVEQTREQGLQDAKSTVQRIGAGVKTIVGTIILMCCLAALYLVVLLAFGGKINFWQSLAVTVYAALPPVVISKLISFILLYIKSPDDIHPLMGQETLLQDNLGILFSPKDHPVMFAMAASIGILSFYRLWLTATGLREGGQKVSKSAAWFAAILLWVIGVILIVTVTAIFPSFIS